MYKIYQIENENTLEQIANKFNISVDKLKQINGITTKYDLRPGNFIIVPANIIGDDNFETYIVKAGDNMYSIAQKYNVDYKQLLDLNGLDKDEYIYINQEIIVPKEGVKFNIVRNNETLSNIADKLNTTIDEIVRQNNTIYLTPEQLIVYKKRG